MKDFLILFHAPCGDIELCTSMVEAFKARMVRHLRSHDTQLAQCTPIKQMVVYTSHKTGALTSELMEQSNRFQIVQPEALWQRRKIKYINVNYLQICLVYS